MFIFLKKSQYHQNYHQQLVAKKEYFTVTEEELGHCLGPPEYMVPTSLGKYLNKDKQKLKFWMDKIVEYIVKKEVKSETYNQNAKKKHRYNYFSNLNEGKFCKLNTWLPQHNL